MTVVILIGLQATGKSTFCQQQFGASHVRINLDMLRTRHREMRFFETCLETGTACVIDNTNASREERKRYIVPAKAACFRIVGYYLRSVLADCIARNARRPEAQRVPLAGLRGTARRLELPCFEEGFEKLHFVAHDGTGGFTIEDWCNDI